MAYFSGVGVHKDGFQVAHEQRVDVQLLAQAVHGNEIEMEIEFGEVEEFEKAPGVLRNSAEDSRMGRQAFRPPSRPTRRTPREAPGLPGSAASAAGLPS